MKKRSTYIIISVIILALSVCFIDAIIKPNYIIKSIIKIIFYLLIPTIYFIINKDELKDFKSLFIPTKKDILKTTILSVSIYLFFVLGYFLVRNFIDFSNITTNLTNNMGIDKNNFIFVTLYISFINSFLEEFFYRGYAFITLKKHINKKTAYIFSSSIFTIYHIGMLTDFFKFPDIILMIIGLFIGGCIFNYLNEKTNNIYPSWIVHMFTNFGINTIGFILFGII